MLIVCISLLFNSEIEIKVELNFELNFGNEIVNTHTLYRNDHHQTYIAPSYVAPNINNKITVWYQDDLIEILLKLALKFGGTRLKLMLRGCHIMGKLRLAVCCELWTCVVNGRVSMILCLQGWFSTTNFNALFRASKR